MVLYILGHELMDAGVIKVVSLNKSIFHEVRSHYSSFMTVLLPKQEEELGLDTNATAEF